MSGTETWSGEVIEQGTEQARKAAQETLEVVRDAVGTRYA